MKRNCLIAFFLLVAVSVVLAGGEAETGRNTAAQQVAEGQLLPVGAVDPGNYLSDFESDFINDGDTPLSVQVALMQDQVWEKGGLTALRIVLAANQEGFFRSTPGLFVLFFQNPELLRNISFADKLADLVGVYRTLDIRIFDAAEETLRPASTSAALKTAVDKIKNQRKMYEQNKLIQLALSTMEAEQAQRSHLLWITDENIAERPADLTFFDFAVELLSGANTTFSYLAYGELPNWASVNETLLKRNGNSYYAGVESEIPVKIERDLGYFSRPAVEDIQITIQLPALVSEKDVFYPVEYYGTMPSFYPTFKNNRPRTVHTLGGMNYGETKRFIHYLEIPTLLSLDQMVFPSPLLEGRTFILARIFVRYYLPMTDSWNHFQQELTVEYVDAGSAGNIVVNRMVELDTILQNTPLIMLEAARLVNSNRDFLLALKLLQAQISLLRKLGPVRPDTAIDEDLETLGRYYEIVFEQARAVNLLE